jgi:methylase of polypeptide subunit release factors
MDLTALTAQSTKSRDLVWNELIGSDVYRMGHYPENYFRTVVDIGACFGLFSCWMANQHPDAQIHAFEPSPVNYKFLRENVEGSNIQIYSEALGSGEELVMQSVEPRRTENSWLVTRRCF